MKIPAAGTKIKTHLLKYILGNKRNISYQTEMSLKVNDPFKAQELHWIKKVLYVN